MIASVTVRHWFHLRQILDTLVTRDIKPKDRIIDTLMMTALAQLAFTRQAEHAVVAESVALGPENGRPWARGLINAVLRNFLRNKAQFLMEKHSEEAQLKPSKLADRQAVRLTPIIIGYVSAQTISGTHDTSCEHSEDDTRRLPRAADRAGI